MAEKSLKPQKVTAKRSPAKKRQLDMALHRARCKAVTIEGEELLHDPELADKPDRDTRRFEREMEA